MTDELTQMRDRLNALERAIADHYAVAEPDASAAFRSWGFTPDASMEAQEARRLRDPAAFGPIPLTHALYLEMKAAAAAKEAK